MRRKLKFVHIIGDGVGRDYAKVLPTVLDALGIEYERHIIEDVRLPDGSLDPAVIEIFKEIPLGIKGPLRTPFGGGATSFNVELRQKLDMFANVRPVAYWPGVASPVKHPELVNTVVFRENTEDVYTGIEWPAGSSEAEKFRRFLIKEMGVAPEKIANPTTGFGVKHISKEASERLMRFTLDSMLKTGRRKLGIMNKGNIMKYTEGLFRDSCINVARSEYADYVWGEELGIPESPSKQIHVSSVTADDAFQQTLLFPDKYDAIITSNLNGDYISDALAAQVGGATLVASGNIGDKCALFEGIGGTGDKIADKNMANPSSFFSAVAMLLDYDDFKSEAQRLEGGIAGVLAEGKGTFDVCPKNPLSTTEFTEEITSVFA